VVVQKSLAEGFGLTVAEAIGREAKESVRHGFLGTRTLMQAIELYERHPHAGAAMKVLEAAGALNVALPQAESNQ
jgi:hypothetical protein